MLSKTHSRSSSAMAAPGYQHGQRRRSGQQVQFYSRHTGWKARESASVPTCTSQRCAQTAHSSIRLEGWRRLIGFYGNHCVSTNAKLQKPTRDRSCRNLVIYLYVIGQRRVTRRQRRTKLQCSTSRPSLKSLLCRQCNLQFQTSKPVLLSPANAKT